MNIPKNARTRLQSLALLIHPVIEERWPVNAVAVAFGVSERTVYKWLARYRAEGAAGEAALATPLTASLMAPAVTKPSKDRSERSTKRHRRAAKRDHQSHKAGP